LVCWLPKAPPQLGRDPAASPETPTPITKKSGEKRGAWLSRRVREEVKEEVKKEALGTLSLPSLPATPTQK
jgi:hypothetical protein